MERGILPGLLGYQLRRAQQHLFQHFATHLGGFGVTPGQVGLLVLVEANPGMSQAALAKTLGMERASLGETVEQLADRGLLVRRPAPGDRRSHALDLSGDGAALLAQVLPRIRAHEAAATATLSEAERETLIRLLDRLAGAVPAAPDATLRQGLHPALPSGTLT